MTLLDAPVFDAARERRNHNLLVGAAGLLVVLFIGGWLVSGLPVDWPWRWWTHFRGRMTVNHFLTAVEQNHAAYPFDRFQQDWSPTSFGNDYGAIKSHKILAARMSGNVLLMGIRINGLKSKNLFIDYDPKTHTLGFSPVELYLGP
jgi:hypothetical protein